MYNKEKKYGHLGEAGGFCLCDKCQTPNKHEDVDKLFDESFVRGDGLFGVSKYDAEIMKHFIHTLLDEKDSERKEALKNQAESILEKMPKERSYISSNSEDNTRDNIRMAGFNQSLSECKEIIKGYIK